MTGKWNYKQLEPVPEEGIRRAGEIMRSGNLFRYCSADPHNSEVALFERDFLADWGGTSRYAIAVNSGTSALMAALKATGLPPGSEVLMPAFTFTAVPSAAQNVGMVPVLVECDMSFKIDLEDLEAKIAEHPDARVLLLSHMRGWISDMDAVLQVCLKNRIMLIEDAAHALGSRWNNQLVGTFGSITVYSFQSYKLINAGEGGMVVTNDPHLAARVLFDQGAYEGLYERHIEKPPDEVLALYVNQRPFYNMRMSEVSAAIARSQLPYVMERIKRYAEVYHTIVDGLSANDWVDIPRADRRETRVLDSVQFRLKDFTPEMMEAFVQHVHSCGVPLEAFGAGMNARAPWNWQYIAGIGHERFPKTHAALDTACDMRIVTSLDGDHCAHFVEAVFDGIKKAIEAPVLS